MLEEEEVDVKRGEDGDGERALDVGEVSKDGNVDVLPKDEIDENIVLSLVELFESLICCC